MISILDLRLIQQYERKQVLKSMAKGNKPGPGRKPKEKVEKSEKDSPNTKKKDEESNR